MTTTIAPRDRAAFLLQAIDPELRKGLLQALGEEAPAEIQLLDAYRRILTRQELRVTIKMIQEVPGAMPALLLVLPPDQAAAALQGLPEEKRAALVREMLALQPKDLLTALGNAAVKLSSKAGALESMAKTAEVLNLLTREEEMRILQELEQEEAELANDLRRTLFVFEDLVRVNDKGIQAPLKEVEHDELALALKTASPDLKAKIFKNMSERAATLIREDMEFMGPVRLSDVEAAQQHIVDIVRRLEEAGEVIIQGSGGSRNVIV